MYAALISSVNGVFITFILSERKTLHLSDTCHHVSFYHLLFPYFVFAAPDHSVTLQKSCCHCLIVFVATVLKVSVPAHLANTRSSKRSLVTLLGSCKIPNT